MTQGIEPWRRTDSSVPAPSESAPAAPERRAEATPNWDDWVNATLFGPAFGGLPEAIDRVGAPRDPRDVAAQQRLEAFRRSMTPVYQAPEPSDDLHWDALGAKSAAVTFTMAGYYSRRETMMKTHPALIAKAAARAHVSKEVVDRIQQGRGAPEEIRVLTQSLIDTVCTPGDWPNWKAETIRALMSQFEIGIDCAGYTQQAYLAVSGLTRTQAHFGSITNEALFNLEARGFRRISSLADVRPGDIVSMTAPAHGVGHRAIVYDQRVATAADVRTLLGFGSAAQAFAVGGRVRVLELDSAWGSYGCSWLGGVKRETFWYNESTGKWAWWLDRLPTKDVPRPPPAFLVKDDLYDHKTDGFFRGGH